MPFAEDMTPFFNAAEFASVAVWGAFSANVLLDKPDEDILGGRVSTTDYQITLAAGDFPGIGRDASITIGAATYKVREVKLVGDGAVKTATLTKL